jgi:hypothetical protein
VEQEAAQPGILWELASGTGGKFINNTNDLGGAFASLAEAPKVTYLLGFSPENLAPDGKFHSLKVNVKEERDLDVQARLGYYAPDHLAPTGEKAAENAKEEIHQAIFGREEIHDIPIDMTTELSKISDTAKSTVRTATKLRWSAACSTAMAATSRASRIPLPFVLWTTLRSIERTELFQCAPSSKSRPANIIRLVARDSEGEMMTAQNGSVEIPK